MKKIVKHKNFGISVIGQQVEMRVCDQGTPHNIPDIFLKLI